MSAELERAKVRYMTCRTDSYAVAAANLRAAVAVPFRFTDWSGRALLAISEQWGAERHPDSSWEWADIIRHYRREPEWLPIVIWIPDGRGERLGGLALGTTGANSVTVQFLEGDPRGDCPLKGKRALMAFEVASCYAQARGKTELRVRPLNTSLVGLYAGLGFTQVSPRNEESYFRKEV